MKTYDPFDIWSNPVLGNLKFKFYKGSLVAKALLIPTYAAEVFAPTLMRWLFRAEKKEYSHVLAMLQATEHALSHALFVDRMAEMQRSHGWGLGFKWYSANGIYPDTMPLITVAPYVMQALVNIPEDSPVKEKAQILFEDSWNFLSSLVVQYEDDDKLALSYAPVKEPFIVVNANSYAAYAYALHAVYGRVEIRAEARARATKLTNWVIRQQYNDGRWYYLAERGSMDMIDGFHTCFVVRNLRYIRALLPEISDRVEINEAISVGWDYIKRELFESEVGLVKRYSVVSRLDPFRYDLYDQAEFLGLLIDFDEIEKAKQIIDVVKKRFCCDGEWFCRIDLFNRRWGCNFLRWGIAQFWVHEARLKMIESGRG